MAGRRIFVTRHSGAPEWARDHGYGDAEFTGHLDPTTVAPGDVVLGTLPIHVAAEVVARGAVFHHLALDLKPEDRGKDLGAREMENAKARLEPYVVVPVSGESVRRGRFSSAVHCFNIAWCAAQACWRIQRHRIDHQ
jgi:CRISPR-associated protein Csx16